MANKRKLKDALQPADAEPPEDTGLPKAVRKRLGLNRALQEEMDRTRDYEQDSTRARQLIGSFHLAAAHRERAYRGLDNKMRTPHEQRARAIEDLHALETLLLKIDTVLDPVIDGELSPIVDGVRYQVTVEGRNRFRESPLPSSLRRILGALEVMQRGGRSPILALDCDIDRGHVRRGRTSPCLYSVQAHAAAVCEFLKASDSANTRQKRVAEALVRAGFAKKLTESAVRKWVSACRNASHPRTAHYSGILSDFNRHALKITERTAKAARKRSVQDNEDTQIQDHPLIMDLEWSARQTLAATGLDPTLE